MKPKIIITDKIHDKAIELAESFAQVDLKTGLSPEQLVEEVPGYDAIVIRSGTRITREVVEAGGLKAVGRAGVGLDNVDLQACRENDVEVFNSPEASTISVAEHAIGLMISLLRNIPRGEATLRKGLWERKKLGGSELYGKTLGVVGFGRIGREVAVRARAFGMNVIVADPAITSEDAREYNAQLVESERLFRESDVITLHVPSIPATKNMVDSQMLSLMKDSAVLVNTARGAVVDEQALVKHLQQGAIKGAALDVYQNEPPEGSPLLELENVVLTPHLAASTEEAQINAGTVVVEKIKNHLT